MNNICVQKHGIRSLSVPKVQVHKRNLSARQSPERRNSKFHQCDVGWFSTAQHNITVINHVFCFTFRVIIPNSQTDGNSRRDRKSNTLASVFITFRRVDKSSGSNLSELFHRQRQFTHFPFSQPSHDCVVGNFISRGKLMLCVNPPPPANALSDFRWKFV